MRGAIFILSVARKRPLKSAQVRTAGRQHGWTLMTPWVSGLLFGWSLSQDTAAWSFQRLKPEAWGYPGHFVSFTVHISPPQVQFAHLCIQIPAPSHQLLCHATRAPRFLTRILTAFLRVPQLPPCPLQSILNSSWCDPRKNVQSILSSAVKPPVASHLPQGRMQTPFPSLQGPLRLTAPSLLVSP